MGLAIAYDDIEAAAIRLAGKTRSTPLMRSDVIDFMSGKNIWFKPECLQHVGAFKYRGAYNRLSVMDKSERRRGVVAFSSGNHAQGVARAAKELGISAVIVMPSDAPKVKVSGVLKDGAEIVFYDRCMESREEIAGYISREQGRIIIPSYDDPYIIAGQGTVGMEINMEARKRQINLDAVIMPMGGGGLCAGISTALRKTSPHIQIYGVEPDGYNDHQLSVRAGRRIAYKNPASTICDAIMTSIPGVLTFPINQQYISDVFTVSDEACLLSMAIIKRELDVQVEPGGVVGLAAVLDGVLNNSSNQNICIVLSGGNVDPKIVYQAENLLQG